MAGNSSSSMYTILIVLSNTKRAKSETKVQWHEVGIGRESCVNITGSFAKDMYGSQVGGKASAREREDIRGCMV